LTSGKSYRTVVIRPAERMASPPRHGSPTRPRTAQSFGNNLPQALKLATTDMNLNLPENKFDDVMNMRVSEAGAEAPFLASPRYIQL
jgi:hypothetical protein